MIRRRTRCLTWGEQRRQGQTLRHPDGTWAGHVSWAAYVTLCGAPEDDTREPEYAGHQDHRGPRPPGVCPMCWRVYRRTCQGASVARVGA
jgi:hypothetical protein